jgi:hypothetical protein
LELCLDDGTVSVSNHAAEDLWIANPRESCNDRVMATDASSYVSRTIGAIELSSRRVGANISGIADIRGHIETATATLRESLIALERFESARTAVDQLLSTTPDPEHK